MVWYIAVFISKRWLAIRISAQNQKVHHTKISVFGVFCGTLKLPRENPGSKPSQNSQNNQRILNGMYTKVTRQAAIKPVLTM